MVEVGDPGVQTQEFLSAFGSSESLLTSLLSPCRSVFLSWAERHPYGACPLLNNVVAAGRGDHPLVIDISQAWDLPDGRPVASELVSMDDVWNIVFSQQPG